LPISAFNLIQGYGLGSEAAYLIYDTLVAHDANLRPVPHLLESWSVAPDRLRLVLRPGIRFHDGQPLTADDLAFTIDEMREQKTAWSGDLKVVSEVRRVDERTVDLRLRQPAPRLVDLLEFGVLPKHLATRPGTAPADLARSPVGAGPYRVREMDETHVALERFDSYYGGSPSFSVLELRTFPADELWRRVLARQIDVAVDIPWSKRRFLERLETIRVSTSARELGLGLRFSRGARRLDQKTRQALTLAIDRTRLGQRAEFGRSSERLDASMSTSNRYDPDRARDVLGKHSITIGILAGLTEGLDIAMELQRQLAALDVDLKISEMAATAKDDDFDLVLVYLRNPAPLEDVAYTYRGDGNLGINSPEVDALFDRISQTEDEASRHLLFERVEEIFRAEAPGTVLFWHPMLNAYRRELCGFEMSNPFTGIDKIRPCS
jgi:peptide/nickel transport system substrate-binding protein